MGSNCQNLRMAAPDAPPLDRWRFRSIPPPLSIPFCLPRASRSVRTLSHQRDPSTPKVTLFQQPFLPQSLIALKNKLHQSIRQMFIYPTVCEFYPSTNWFRLYKDFKTRLKCDLLVRARSPIVRGLGAKCHCHCSHPPHQCVKSLKLFSFDLYAFHFLKMHINM